MYKYILKILPKSFLSWLTGYFTTFKSPKFIVQFIIRNYFIKKLKVNINELIEKDIRKYKSINDFFTRKLDFKYRKIELNKNKLISPCDGRYLSGQNIKKDKLIQFKNKFYYLNQIFEQKAEQDYFINGTGITIYLSPKDYHRVHCPYPGILEKIEYIPGKLFPVNEYSVKNINSLYPKNERLQFKIRYSKNKYYYLIMIGAFNVGKMSSKFIDNFYSNKNFLTSFFYKQKIFLFSNVSVKKGEELGIFNLGSTVVLLFPSKSLTLLSNYNNKKLVIGQEIIKIKL